MATKSLKRLHVSKGTEMDLVQFEGRHEEYAAITTFDGRAGHEPFHVPAHWHRNHDEHITVLEGRMNVSIDGKTRILRPEDGTLTVRRFQVHSFWGFKGERTVFEERNDPNGIYKALFFNDMFPSGGPGFWRGVRGALDGDTYFSVPPFHSKLIDQFVVFLFGFIAKLFVPAKEKTL